MGSGNAYLDTCIKKFLSSFSSAGLAAIEDSVYIRGWQTSSIKSQIVNIFDFAGHLVSVTIQFYFRVAGKQPHTICKQVGVPIKLYLQKQVAGQI